MLFSHTFRYRTSKKVNCLHHPKRYIAVEMNKRLKKISFFGALHEDHNFLRVCEVYLQQ